MDSVKEIIIALGILISSGYGLIEINKTVKAWALESTKKGTKPLAPFTSKLTGISQKRIEDGYVD